MNYSASKVNNTPFIVIAILSHLYAFFSFGAVFWIDSVAYASLGYALGKSGGLIEFYTDIGTWFYLHLQPGVPLVWLGTSYLPVDWQWPVVAGGQHILAAISLFYFFTTINSLWPSRWNYVGCLIVSLLPFYQAPHNSLMTESISSSLFLLGFGLVMRMRVDARRDIRDVLVLSLLIFLITQFRSYLGLLIVLIYLLPCRALSKPDIRASLFILISLILGVLSYPSYRYYETDLFSLPSLGMNKLQTGWWSNPIPSEQALAALDKLDFPKNLLPTSRINKGLDYDEVAEVGWHWRAEGLTDIEINDRAYRAGSILSTDSVEVFRNRVLLALTSSGLTTAYCWVGHETIVFPGYSAERFCAHVKQTYVFQSWLSVVDHSSLFDRYFDTKPVDNLFKMPFEKVSADSIYRSTKGYLSNTPLAQRDPLMLGHITPDWIIIISILMMIVFALSRNYFASMCLLIILGNAAVGFFAPLGNPRYGYFLFPIYIGFAFASAPLLYFKVKSISVRSGM